MAQDLSGLASAQAPEYQILIIDDNPTNLGVITKYLRDLGCHISVATNGEKALKRARVNQPDLILLDVLLPSINGYEVCRRLKADPQTRNIPIIFMTVLSAIEDKVRAFRAGAVDYVTKPIQAEEVTARVMTHLQLRSLTRHLQDQADELARVNAELSQANAEILALNAQLQAENIQVRQDLSESQHNYLTLAEEMSDGYVVLQSGRIVFANRAFAHMHGKTPESVAGEDFRQFVEPGHRGLVMQFYAKSCHDLVDSPLIGYRRVTSSGQTFPTEIKLKSLAYETALFTIGICRDITERVELERKMRESERLSYIGRMASSLSHELRNPLSAINMNLQLLQEGEELSKEGGRCLAISIDAMRDMEHSLSQLLDFARPLHLQIAPCRLPLAASTCVTLLEGKLSAKALTIENECASALEPVQADGEKISQVLLNLLLNAIEASPQGGVIRIACHPAVQNGMAGVSVSIADEGPGIADEHVELIFEPFFTTKAQGTGLGLANARQIVESHRGVIRFAPRQPHGAVFSVWLPWT